MASAGGPLQHVGEHLLGQIHPLGSAKVIRALNDRVDDDGGRHAPRFGQQNRLFEATGLPLTML